jgi:hypothetical protein
MPEGAVERKKNLRSERPGLVGWGKRRSCEHTPGHLGHYPSRPRDEGTLISRPPAFHMGNCTQAMTHA